MTEYVDKSAAYVEIGTVNDQYPKWVRAKGGEWLIVDNSEEEKACAEGRAHFSEVHGLNGKVDYDVVSIDPSPVVPAPVETLEH